MNYNNREKAYLFTPRKADPSHCPKLAEVLLELRLVEASREVTHVNDARFHLLILGGKNEERRGEA